MKLIYRKLKIYLAGVQKAQKFLDDLRLDVLDDHPVGGLFGVVGWSRQHGREDLGPRDQDRLVNGKRNFASQFFVYKE